MRIAVLIAAAALIGPALRLAQPPAPAAPPAPASAVAAASDTPIYVGGLAPGWQDWSWAQHALQSVDERFHGRSAIRMTPQGWQGVYLHADHLDTSHARELWLWVHGGPRGGQKINVAAAGAGGKFLPPVDLGKCCVAGKIPAGRWTLAIVPLSRLQARGKPLTGFVFQDAAGAPQPPVYFADIVLKNAAPVYASRALPITVQVDTTQDAHAISPFIYGLAGGSEAMKRDLRCTVGRWGGNPSTRYNWEKGNCWNAGRDWEFRNVHYGPDTAEARQPSGAADMAVADNRALGTATLLTIPTIGYVARNSDNDTRSLNVPARGGKPLRPGSDAIAGYDPTENQRRTSVRSYPRKRRPFIFPPDLTDEAVYQDEWIAHLVSRFGKAKTGGVRFYAMDNEPDLWASTHTDAHPVQPGYDDLLSTFLQYASAVKDVDPTAEITGPVSWGWTGYFHSPRDAGNWNGRPDRKAHGDEPFIPWFLEQVRRHDKKTGRRLLDVLDIHFYPQAQGVYAGKTDATTDALRLRSTRALWDRSYADESWIREPVYLIPRMKEWIARYYPGTKLGITEWNWGADTTMNGALAIAECLGVFGREGVYLANYWTAPPETSPGRYAFQIYRNADGKGHGFGDRAVRTVCSAPDRVSCFGAVDTKTGEPTLMILNKQPDKSSVVTVSVRGSRPYGTAALWRYDASHPSGIAALPAVRLYGRFLRITVPPSSITLARLR